MSHCDQVPCSRAMPKGHTHGPHPQATPTGHAQGHAHGSQPWATPVGHSPQHILILTTPTTKMYKVHEGNNGNKLSLYVYAAEFCLFTDFSRIFVCGTLCFFMSCIYALYVPLMRKVREIMKLGMILLGTYVI